jgi:hypothetical protein
VPGPEDAQPTATLVTYEVSADGTVETVAEQVSPETIRRLVSARSAEERGAGAVSASRHALYVNAEGDCAETVRETGMGGHRAAGAGGTGGSTGSGPGDQGGSDTESGPCEPRWTRCRTSDFLLFNMPNPSQNWNTPGFVVGCFRPANTDLRIRGYRDLTGAWRSWGEAARSGWSSELTGTLRFADGTETEVLPLDTWNRDAASPAPETLSVRP